jgi:hypothetical protein
MRRLAALAGQSLNRRLQKEGCSGNACLFPM